MNFKILHIISSLSAGGAQMMMYKLIGNTNEKVEHEVISLTGNGLTSKKLKEQDISAISLQMGKNLWLPGKVLKLKKYINKFNPDIVQTWMYHSDLLGGIAAKLAGGYPVVWNIRHSNLTLEADKRTTIWTAKICAKFSTKIPERIVTCSNKAKQLHGNLGYDKNKIKVIPNGFDLAEFKKRKRSRESLIEELSLPGDSFLIGMAARFNPQKDYDNLLSAVKILKNKFNDYYQNVQLILCGKGMNWRNDELISLIKEKEIREKINLLDKRDDMPFIMSALDINTLSSRSGEGFPNVIGEAMACETPCVVTNVGDSADIVGNSGIVVPPQSPIELAEGWKNMMDLTREEREDLGRKARQRIKNNFDIDIISQDYLSVYKRVINNVV